MRFPSRCIHVAGSRVFSYFHAAIYNWNGISIGYPVEQISRHRAIDAAYQNIAIPRRRIRRLVLYLSWMIDDPDFPGSAGSPYGLLGNVCLQASNISRAGIQQTIQIVQLYFVMIDQHQFTYARPSKPFRHHASYAAEADYAYSQCL